MTYKLKSIVWKNYEGLEIGYVGNVKMFTIIMDDSRPDNARWKLLSKTPYPPVNYDSIIACKELAKSYLQKLVANLVD